MPLHRLTTIDIGVPDVEAACEFYRDFGLKDLGEGRYATSGGGEQLRIVPSARRRLVTLGLGVDDRDDLDRIASTLAGAGHPTTVEHDALEVTEPGTGVHIRITLAERLVPVGGEPAPHNGAGAPTRTGERAPAFARDETVRPRRLGHVVVGSVDQAASQQFFTDLLGFKISDRVGDVAAFLRCSSDHHNLLVQRAPVRFLHHTSWQVDDVDEIGRGAKAMLDKDPSRHTWGLGRHFIGSNFFWYLRDPAGNFAEYYADLDVIVDDDTWEPGVFTDARALYAWGPPPPPSFLAPDDLAELMTGA